MPTTVGIMSMHRIHNYGSTLQAYALRRIIEATVVGAEVSVVDYVPGKVLVDTPDAGGSASKIARTFSKVAEYGQVNARLMDKLRFLNHKRSYGARYFPMVGIPVETTRALDLDVQVIGSDEVFNCVQANTKVGYSRELFGHGSPAKRLISYAASFGNTTVEKIDEVGIRKELAEDLSKFCALSVRDANSADVVEQLTGDRPVVHVDPVLAFDFMADEPRVPRTRLYKGRYIVVYAYSGRFGPEENNIVRRHAREVGATILCFGGVQECGDRFVDCNPFELLAYFRDADAVITDTFHGTILAMINSKPFGTIIRQSVGNA
jgi:hypothetical protein